MTTISRRNVLKGGAGLITALAMSGRYNVPMINAQDKGKVVAWVTHSDDDLKSLQAIAKAFNEQSDKTEVKIEQVPGSDGRAHV